MKQRNFLLITFLLTICTFISLTLTALADEAYVQIESQKVFLGEPFNFKIIVISDNEPNPPTVENTKDFQIESLGSSTSSSSNVTIVNGRMQQQTEFRHIYNYNITAKKLGELTIPSFNIVSSGNTLRTKPVAINVIEPQNDKNFKLIQKLSKDSVYVGEPVTLTVTWYLNANTTDFNFSFPLLDQDYFFIKPLDFRQNKNSNKDIIRFTLQGQDVIAKKGVAQLNGQPFTTVTFQEVIIPKKSGEFKIPKIVVAGKKIVSYQRQQNHRGFGGFFDFDPFEDFFESSQPVYQRFAVPSNQPTLTVKNTPEENKPYDYTGLVGDYSIIANATPLDVNVGDPVTLNIEIAGPDYMENVSLYPLDQQKYLTDNFKIPTEMSAPVIQKGIASFTQTIRPLRADVKEIPPIRLSYFDSSKGKYVTTKSDPIPIKVTSARIVTAADAEGVSVSPAEVIDNIAPKNEGINYNYTDEKILLTNQDSSKSIFHEPFWLLVIFLPFLAFLAITSRKIWNVISSQKTNTNASYYVKKLNDLCAIKASASQILATFREYIIKKFSLPKGSTSFSDVEHALYKLKASSDLILNVKETFTHLEAACYAGNKDDELYSKITETVNKIEKEIK